MEIEADPPVEILPWTFNVLVAPEETALSLLRSMLDPRRFLFLYVCGNYSRLLSRINLRNAEFDVRRAFTSSQLLSIVDEAHHTFVFIEHDESLYAESEEMAGYLSLALRELSRESTVVLYSPAFDETLQAISNKADRVLCLERMAYARSARPHPRRTRRDRMPHGLPPGEQRRLEAF